MKRRLWPRQHAPFRPARPPARPLAARQRKIFNEERARGTLGVQSPGVAVNEAFISTACDNDDVGELAAVCPAEL